MQFLWNNKNIFVNVIGKGKPVLFLHAFGLDHSAYTPFLTPLGEEYKFYIPDLPGIGLSESIPEYSMEALASLFNALIKSIGEGPVYVVGHSIGGYIALEMLASNPQNISKLVLLHSFCGTDSDEKIEQRKKNIDFINKYGTALFLKELLSNLFLPSFSGSHRFVLDTLIHQSSKFSAEGMTGLINAMIRRKDHSKTLQNAPIPICFILGTDDKIIPHDAALNQVALPPITEVFFAEGAGHMGTFETPQLIRRALRKYLH